MRWGVHRNRSDAQSSGPIAKYRKRKAQEKQAQADKTGALKRLASMSDDELRDRVNRMNLEKQYKQYVESIYPKRKSAVGEFLKKAGGQLLSNVVNKTTEQIAANIAKKLQKEQEDKISKTKIKDVTKVGDKALEDAIKRLNKEKAYKTLVNS
jgi:hypothetical protein